MKKSLLFGCALSMAAMAFAQNPECLYVVGNVNGWNTPNTDTNLIVLSDNGSGIYSGECDTPDSTLEFKIFSAKSDWNNSENYWAVEGNPMFADNSVTFTIGGGSGENFTIYDWKYTKAKFTVEWTTKKLTVTAAGDEKEPVTPEFGHCIYLVGDPQGWDIDGDSMPLNETEEGSGVYDATYNIASGSPYLRFYTALGNWDANSIGAQVPDKGVTITFENGQYEGACVNGKGAWNFDWAGGDLYMKVDLNKMTVYFADPAMTAIKTVESTAVEGAIYDLFGRKVNKVAAGIYIVNGKKTVIR